MLQSIRLNGTSALLGIFPSAQAIRDCTFWRIVHQLPQEVSHQVPRLDRPIIIHPTGIRPTHWIIGRRSASQLAKGTLHLGVPGYAFEYNAKLTHQGTKKAVHICSKHSPARFLGVLSLAVAFGNLGCVY